MKLAGGKPCPNDLPEPVESRMRNEAEHYYRIRVVSIGAHKRSYNFRLFLMH